MRLPSSTASSRVLEIQHVATSLVLTALVTVVSGGAALPALAANPSD